MKFSAISICLALAFVSVSGHQLPSRYSGQRRGNQFVTGPCTQDSDCQQGCCGFNSGKCAGPAFAQTADGGCGFGNKNPNCNVAAALKLADCAEGAVNGDLSSPDIQQAAKFVSDLDGIPFKPSSSSSSSSSKSGSKSGSLSSQNAAPPASSPSAASSSGSSTLAALAAGQSGLGFVTKSCSADSECQQGCCAFDSGKCAGPGIAQTRDGGCGHGNPTPNCNVAKALGLNDCAPNAVNGDINSQPIQAAAAFTAILDGIQFTPSVSTSSGSSSGASNVESAPTSKSSAATSSKSSGSSLSISALAAKQSSLKFVTESCSADSECQQGCCAFDSGKCAGPGIAQTRDGGCGHGNKSPNCDVATALNLGDCAADAAKADITPQVQAAAAFTSLLDNLPFTLA